jgi:5-methylcytosine-specific restriction endonuclease McrA
MALTGKRKRRLIAQFIEAQQGQCCYCHRPFSNEGDRSPTIEHKKARMDGGKDDIANLAAACKHCNQHRGRQMHESRQRERRKNAPVVVA